MGAITNSPGKLLAFIGSLAANSRSRLHPTRSSHVAAGMIVEKASYRVGGGKVGNVAPDTNGLDLLSVEPVFINYSVTQADLQNVGKLPGSPKEQAKLKALLYRNPADAIAEKFHCDVHFLEQLNPGKTKSIKPGDQLRVPNVQPLDLGQVKEIKPGSEINRTRRRRNNRSPLKIHLRAQHHRRRRL